MSIINVRGLTKKYADFYAVDHISFSVERGTMLGFLGVNGAGKSTTIHMLSTLLRADAGSAELCGCMVGAQDSHIRRKIGIVYQQNCLDDLLSVKENLLHRGILHGATKKGSSYTIEESKQNIKTGKYFKKKIPHPVRRTEKTVRDCSRLNAYTGNFIFR